jgi:transcriptional regulator with XRE-family HTH domain
LVKVFVSFNEDDYKKRLQLLRAMYGETQEVFAERLGIPFKRWNQYERGYPIPRETAWLIRQKLYTGIIEWIWFGDETVLNETFRKRLRAVELADRKRSDDRVKEQRSRQKAADKALRKASAD